MLRRTPPFLLAVLLLWPAGASAAPLRGGSGPNSALFVWHITVRMHCIPPKVNGPLCQRLLGPVEYLSADITVRGNTPAPGLTFSAVYVATGFPLPPGAGIRAFGRLCAFGILPDRQRFIRGPFDGSTTCQASVTGRMTVRPGGIWRLISPGTMERATRLSTFWATRETAVIPGALERTILDPLGRRSYPADSRLPALTGGNATATYDANQYLGMLGFPGFPQQAVPLPPGLFVRVSVQRGRVRGA